MTISFRYTKSIWDLTFIFITLKVVSKLAVLALLETGSVHKFILDCLTLVSYIHNKFALGFHTYETCSGETHEIQYTEVSIY